MHLNCKSGLAKRAEFQARYKISTDMSKLTEEQIARGRGRFLADHPQAVDRVNAITQAVADALGEEVTELRRIETAKAMSEAAAAEGIDGFEYLLRYAIDDDDERNRILQQNREAHERAVGLRW
ncbi:DUF6388 family protein [Cupriavidus basilensis]|uniref:DUF6388 family protein n=1 Tax=Cupriavidus basilensis TaxID=68895 RepID=A0ABT6B407_9BURK|nr:DUF6388 family protein [Cupriavidus basilensis]MDF3839614.1 DUF6388 family protein [Cupriavidus basilensis]